MRMCPNCLRPNPRASPYCLDCGISLKGAKEARDGAASEFFAHMARRDALWSRVKVAAFVIVAGLNLALFYSYTLRRLDGFYQGIFLFLFSLQWLSSSSRKSWARGMLAEGAVRILRPLYICMGVALLLLSLWLMLIGCGS